MRPFRSLQFFPFIFDNRVICPVICYVIGLLTPFTAQAQSSAEIAAALSTRSYKRADAALNIVYSQYMTGSNGYRLLPEGKHALKEAQLVWLKFRDAEATFVASGYVHTHTHTGGRWVEVYASALTALTDERIRHLKEGVYNGADSDGDPDTELNAAYKALLSVLDDRQKKLVTTAELAWIKFRDAEANRFLGPKPKFFECALDQLTGERARALKASYLRYKRLNSQD